jgi:hypothetical protein
MEKRTSTCENQRRACIHYHFMPDTTPVHMKIPSTDYSRQGDDVKVNVFTNYTALHYIPADCITQSFSATTVTNSLWDVSSNDTHSSMPSLESA